MSSKNQGVLIPKKVSSGRWQVSLGIVWEGDKKRNPRKQFLTRALAQDFCNSERARRKAHGGMTADADGALVAAWMDLEGRLQAAGAGSLADVGQRALRDALAITRTGSAAACLDACHNDLQSMGRRGVYLADLRGRCGRFLAFFGENRAASEITPAVVTAYFESIKDGAEVNRRTLSAWLGWAADHGWLPANPCLRKRRRGTKNKSRSKAVTISPVEAGRMLKLGAQSEDLRVLATVAISLFAGLRPSEIRKRAKDSAPADLRWEDVGRDHITVSEDLAKTGVGRVVPICPALRAWLDYIGKKSGGVALTGPIQHNGWRKTWDAWRAEFWVDGDGVPIKWHANQMRHSYGSYHLAKGRNAGDTALNMGNSPDVVLRYYWNWETLGGDADKFFSLTPQEIFKKGLQVVA